MGERVAAIVAASVVLATGAYGSTPPTPGTVDRGWGDRGMSRVLRVSGDSRGVFDAAYADPLVRDRGQVLLVADEATDCCSYVSLFRFTAAGLLDRSFGTDGKVQLPGIAGVGRFARLLPDGRILAAAGDRLYRFTADGAPDRSFGENGSIRLVVGGCAYRPIVAAPGPGGSLFVSVILCSGSPSTHENTWRIIRVSPSGNVDEAYGTRGVATVKIGHPRELGFRTYASQLLPQPDGSLIVGATTSGSNDELDLRAALARFRPDGSLDPTFGQGGRRVFSTAFEGLDTLLPGPNGGVIVAGCQRWNETGPVVLGRFTRDLSPITSWSPDGLRAFDVPGPGSICASFAPATDGKLVFVGGDQISRYLPDGAPDPSFGSNGSAHLSRGTYRALLVQPDGDIVVAGTLSEPAHTPHRLIQLIRING
jgi:uncharacterized delta-60 repeat protein